MLPAPPADDPVQHLYSSDSDDLGVLQGRVNDLGSRDHCVTVSVQGVPVPNFKDNIAMG